MLYWPRDVDRLESGNTLITDSRNGRVLEVDPDGRVVWSFTGLAVPYEADRLENGNTLIADNNHRRVIEVDPGGQIVWSFRNFEFTYSTELENGGFEAVDDTGETYLARAVVYATGKKPRHAQTSRSQEITPPYRSCYLFLPGPIPFRYVF